MSCDAFQVGDNGQRYEVRFLDGDEKEQVFGWTNDPTGADMVEVIELHPVWHWPRIIDRGEESK